MKIILGKWTEDSLNDILRESSGIAGAGQRIDFLSQLFLDVKYQEETLTGDEKTPEEVVINLAGVDCFTFLDYVEAMRLSGMFSEFTEKVRRVRYRDGIVSFENRNHFFTDWLYHNKDFVGDVSENICGGRSLTVQKQLNKKEDGACFVKGIQTVSRELTYIPSASVDDATKRRLKTGDYMGIYSREQGLDVSHVGIIIQGDGRMYFRHASTRQGKVVDEDFREYIAGKPGIVVVRPKEVSLYDS